MSVLSPALRRRIIRRHHTVTATELHADGVPARDVSMWLTTGVLTEVRRQVYAVTDALRNEPFLTRSAALCIDDDRVCDAITSAHHWDLPGVFRPTHPTAVPIEEVVRAHVVRQRGGVLVLSPAATWFGLAEVLRPEAFVSWSHSVLGERIDVVEAHRVVRRLGDPSRAAHRRAAAVMSSSARWQRPSGTDLERRVRASMRRRGITGLDGAHTIELTGGLRIHPTVVDHELRWGIEIDHRSWHGGRHSPAFAGWLDRQLRRRGWAIELVSDRRLQRDVAGQMSALVERYRAAQNAAITAA